MKQIFLITALGAITGLGLATAQAASPNPQFLGTWVMDVSKIQPQPPSPPKSVVVRVRDLGGGRWITDVVTELADGTRQTRAGIPVNNDGTPTPIPGSMIGDSVQSSFPDAHTRVLTATKGGKTVQTEVSKLSADGKQMVLTVDAVTPDGKQLHRREIFNRK